MDKNEPRNVSTCALIPATALIAFMVAGSTAHSVTVVYDNAPRSSQIDALSFAHDPYETSSSAENPNGAENFSEIAQLITLAGSDRYATKIDLWLGRFPFQGSSRTAVLDATVRLFTVSGDLQTGLPGQLLYEGTLHGMILAAGATVPLTFTPNINVPTQLFLSISNPRVQIDQPFQQPQIFAGFRTSSNLPRPRIGTAVTTWRQRNTTTGVWSRDFFGGSSSYLLNARIEAVPSLSSLTPLLALPLITRRRR
jgi:hypothetical protein